MILKVISLSIYLFFSCSSLTMESTDVDLRNRPTENSTQIFQNNACVLKDGEYEADVAYYNPSTGSRRNYTLMVDVEDCEVTKIHFPKGGWLDGTHIVPGEIDEDGDATIYDEKKRRFDIHIEIDEDKKIEE